MFMRDSFTPTYSGPFMASGETLSRAKSQTAADRALAGNERGYISRNRGVQAGNKGSIYRAGLMAESQGAQAGNVNAASMARAIDDAQSRLAYQTNAAEESEGLRRLLFDTDQTSNIAENALRKDMSYKYLGNLRRRADSKIGRLSRDTDFFGWLGGLFS